MRRKPSLNRTARGAFAGADVEAAVVSLAAQAMMVEYDRRAAHYEIAHSFEVG